MKKLITGKRVGITVIVLIIIGLIGSCAFGTPPQKEYELTVASTQNVQTLVSVVGSVKPEKETNLSFQQGGTLDSLLVKEGDTVLSGQLLAEVDPTTYMLDVESKKAMLELEKISLQKLQNGLRPEDEATLDTTITNAERSLQALNESIAATQEKNKSQIGEAELQVANARQQYEATKEASTKNTGVDLGTAKSGLESAQRSLTLTIKTNEETIKSAQNRVKEAEVALANARTDLQTGQPIQDKNIENAQVKAFYEAAVFLDGVDKSLRAVNEIITVEDYNSGANASYRDLLGVKKLNSYTNVEFAYSALKNKYNGQRALFDITSEVLSYDEILRRITVMKGLLDDSFSLLTNASVLLDNSITSTSFPVSELNRLKNAILNQRDTLASNLTGAVNTRQSVESLELQKTSNVSSLQGRVNSAEAALSSSKIALSSAEVQAESALQQAKTALQQAQDNLSKTEVGTDVKNLDIDRLFNAYREAEERLATTKASIIEQDASIAKTRIDLESQVRSAKAQRNSQAAPARPEDIRTQQERIRQAEIGLQLAEKTLQNAKIIAPKDGVISTVSISAGENVAPGSSAIKLISDKADIIEANIAETEIASLEVGQKVKIDFDAFDRNETYEGRVTFINPDKTSLDGVIYYRIEVTFDPSERPDREVRPGFSANLDIITEEVRALAVENGALKQDEDDKYYVEVPSLQNGAQIEEKRYVEIGLEGEEFVEIRSGLSEGENVVLSVTTK